MRDYLKETCFLIDIKFTIPERFISHRWLSCYDVSLSNLAKLDAHSIFYFGFLTADNKDKYKHILEDVYRRRKVSEQGKEVISGIHVKLAAKKMTEDGEKRKKNCIEKLFHGRVKTKLI